MDTIKKINKYLNEEDYETFFKKKLKQWKVTSPAKLSKEDKVKFFSEIEKE